MFNLEKAHFLLDEMVMNGYIIETNKTNVLKPILLLEKTNKSQDSSSSRKNYVVFFNEKASPL